MLIEDSNDDMVHDVEELNDTSHSREKTLDEQVDTRRNTQSTRQVHVNCASDATRKPSDFRSPCVDLDDTPLNTSTEILYVDIVLTALNPDITQWQIASTHVLQLDEQPAFQLNVRELVPGRTLVMPLCTIKENPLWMLAVAEPTQRMVYIHIPHTHTAGAVLIASLFCSALQNAMMGLSWQYEVLTPADTAFDGIDHVLWITLYTLFYMHGMKPRSPLTEERTVWHRLFRGFAQAWNQALSSPDDKRCVISSSSSMVNNDKRQWMTKSVCQTMNIFVDTALDKGRKLTDKYNLLMRRYSLLCDALRSYKDGIMLGSAHTPQLIQMMEAEADNISDHMKDKDLYRGDDELAALTQVARELQDWMSVI